MRAAWYERNGPAHEVLQVGERPDPVPGPGEVRVRLRTSGVNPSDAKGRGGNRAMAAALIVPGSDGAGVIDRVGPRVPRRRLGERVWIYYGQHRRAHGTSAQYIALPAHLAVPLPEKIPYAAGACLGVPVMTAHRCVFCEGPVQGLTLLVTGGAGVVGHYAVQLARWGGARVIATVSSADKAAHAKKGGAHAVIDYRTEDVAARLREITGGAGIDRVVDVELGVNLPTYAAALRPNAAIACYASVARQEALLPLRLRQLNLTLRMVYVYTMPEAARRRALSDIARWLEDGRPKFTIAQRFPLDRIAEAHEFVEHGQRIGHVVVDVG
jgi:NADPH2:quinone reductase